MDRLKSFKSLSLVTGVFTTIWVMGIGWQPPLQAQSNEDVNVLTAQLSPSRDRGAGLRGAGCGEATITPLMPTNDQGVYLVALNSPATLSWQVPETTVTSAEFLLVDQSWNPVYQTMIEIPEAGGEVEITLPNDLSLKRETDYYFQFALVCDAADRTKDNAIQGAVQFTAPDASTPEE
ncbi:MAG: DUF928 domain-containing protein [Coleofasciculus sp. B1-GNL1-01]|uniref:DUF928 domain-containing protein n=1 Tax=Coleofasciculus sp. B1-GNL1-01 TaxID=3068484 RepID=UPI0032F4641C